MLMVMVLSALAALLFSLWMVYRYVNNVRTTNFHHQILLDAVAEARFRKLTEETELASAWGSVKESTTAWGDETDAQRAEREESHRQEEEVREKQHKEREILNRQKAREEAKTLVPESLSVAGMGITGSFFIELTAILTIIFGIIILGLVGVLGTREIAPILAAIAGYVLGKTTSASAGQVQQASPTSLGGSQTGAQGGAK